jgi:hypothetical protein
MKCYVVSYTESSTILRLYDPQKYRIFTSMDIVFSESTKCLELTKIELLANIPLDQDDNTTSPIKQK